MPGFGIDQLNKETPKWARWTFGISFIATTAFSAWVAATNIFDPNTKYEITIFLKLVVDPIVYGVSHMFGIDPEDK